MATHINKARKPIRVAGDKEFGEKYHVAAALVTDPVLEALVVGPDKHFAVPFLSLFAEARISHIEESMPVQNHRRVADSTRIYAPKWSPHTVRRLSTTVLDATQPKKEDMDIFLSQRMPTGPEPAALVWIRNEDYEPNRNSTAKSVAQLIEVVCESGLKPILIGSCMDKLVSSSGNLIEFFKSSLFADKNSIATQLSMFHALMQNYGVCVSVGMKSGGMDGPGLFFGLRTISFSGNKNSSRVNRIAKAIRNFSVIPLDKCSENVFQEHTPAELDRLRSAIRATHF